MANRSMFNTIVVATDGSKNANAAVEAACEIQSQNPSAELHVATAYHPLTPQQINELREALPEEFATLLHGNYIADERIDEAKMIVKRAGSSATFHEVHENPAEGILDLAEHLRADLIVVGSRGEGVGRRIIHGSVSTKVLHHARCSVLVVKL